MTVGVVVIGRNEGDRLVACLNSVIAPDRPVVYVDSGSSDNSVATARTLGVSVVELDTRQPFTAARARNAGFARLKQQRPDLSLVQFIDGDCTLSPDWLAYASHAILSEPQCAVVCGRRRERFLHASVYNRLCDHEWNTPVGVADACGGDALMRVDAFESAGGFTPTMIAGEEPDLCRRMRARGWIIRRLDHDMTVHDAAMTRWQQWWQRNRRSGFASAEALTRYGHRDRAALRRVLSNLFWTLPIAWPLWPLLWLRVRRQRDALYATAILLGKLPHLHGQFDHWLRRRRLIEYK